MNNFYGVNSYNFINKLFFDNFDLYLANQSFVKQLENVPILYACNCTFLLNHMQNLSYIVVRLYTSCPQIIM